MKKILIVLYLIAITVYLSAQNGDGSSGNPFWGTISGNVQWSVGDPNFGSTVYVGTSSNPDLTIGSGGHLTIDPGITVIFTQLTSDLFVTGTGQLTAGGTGTSVIFTKDSGKSHWGHISFESMSGTPAGSTFDNCIFEYGYSSGTNLQPLLAGGVLQIDFNGVIITNCLFQNNNANYAGAVMINSNRNTIFRKSYFASNTANECGGAMVIYNGSTALIENCIFYSNYSKGTSSAGYSGGAIWSYSNTSKVVNCTFVENNSDRPGDAFYTYNSSGTKLINSILWGSSDQFATTGTAGAISYCAFETTKPANATYSIVISDVASDHFNNAGSGDWSLKFISPCRDAGTNSYGTPNIVPATDYIGNSRVLTTDIGAYEVQYSLWKTTASSTDWASASNWVASVDPGTGTGDVVIPTGATNYPTGSTTQDFTIGSGKQMIIEQGARVTLDGLTNNGTLKLNSTSAGFASLIINSYIRGAGATEEIQLFLTGGGSELLEDYKWHYISTPVSTLSTDVFTGVTLDLAQFVESRPALSLLQGWVAYDGYVYSTGLSNGPTFNTLTPGKGYNFWDGVNNTFTFGGLFNTSNVPMSISYSGVPSLHGFNLLGNPFASGLNWNDIINNVYFTYPANTSKGVYFTRDNVQCSYIGGVGVPGDVDGIIPPMQGFFTKTYSTGNSITLPAAARTHSGIHARYKGEAIIPLVRLQLSKDTIYYDETVVRFDEQAKSNLDNDFDAIKMFISSSKNQIYSSLEGTDYAINGQPFPLLSVQIPVVVNITAAGNYKVSSTQLQGLDNYNVTLVDNTTGFIADLKTTPDVIFSSAAGTFTDRFTLIISITTGIENPVVSKSQFNIYPYNGMINVVPLGDDWSNISGTINVIDFTGRSVGSIDNVEFQKNVVSQVTAPGTKGMYMVEIRSGVKRYVGKVVIK